MPPLQEGGGSVKGCKIHLVFGALGKPSPLSECGVCVNKQEGKGGHKNPVLSLYISSDRGRLKRQSVPRQRDGCSCGKKAAGSEAVKVFSSTNIEACA